MAQRWFDPRLAIGAVLVAVAMAASVFVIGALNRTEEVWTVTTTRVTGDTIGAGDVRLARVQIEGLEEHYFGADESPVGVVVTDSIAAGELIPRSRVAESDTRDLSSVVLELPGPLASGVTRGQHVTVWAAAPTERGEFAAPVVLVKDAIVVAVHEPEGLVASTAATRVEVLVPNDATAPVLEAVSNRHRLHIVPGGGGQP